MSNSDVIATFLAKVKDITKSRNAQIIASDELTRFERETLIASNWLQEIIRGWYMLVRPDTATGDTAAWYANFWDFVRIYLEHRFGNDYCLAAEPSLDLHTANSVIPQQVIVIVKKGAGLRKLIYNTSLMLYVDANSFPTEQTQILGINVMSLAYALCKASPSYFQKNPRDAEIALKTIKDINNITRIIVKHNLKAAASRIIGAYKFLQDLNAEKQIVKDLVMAGIAIKSTNPFKNSKPFLKNIRIKSPYASRIKAMWSQARNTVITNFPKQPKSIQDHNKYLQHIDEIYQYDAYNSLSIEGYQVTEDLIDKVKNQKWDPVGNQQDNNSKNALAAKGYFIAFEQVKQCISNIIKSNNAAKIVKNNLQNWYKALFSPAVQVGLIATEDLFGYRNERVFIRNSRHSPPPKEAVLDSMEAFFECLEQEPNPEVNAILGHYFFVYIHPYMDGNGRIARFLMNAFLAAGGYTWTVVTVQNRNKYISTLEATHMNFDMTDFTKFIASEMYNSP